MSRWARAFEAEFRSLDAPANSANSANSPVSDPIGAIVTIGSGIQRESSAAETQDAGEAGFPKTNVMTTLGAEVSRLADAWDTETAAHVRWFLTTPPPTETFELQKGVTVLDPARWWQAIRNDIAAGTAGPRARYGALQGDLRRVAGLFRPEVLARAE